MAWEPPSRVLLAWQITPSFTYDPDLITELDIRFTAKGSGTRVEVEHRLDSYGAAAEDMFKTAGGQDYLRASHKRLPEHLIATI